MKFHYLIYFLLCFLNFFSQPYTLEKVGVTNEQEFILSKHTYYQIGFSIKYHLPAWTYYSNTTAHLNLANLDRKGSFAKDPLINSVQANNEDYRASGYDKGHLVPCEDMSFDEKAMKETFYYSNCAPQTTELNRGEWKVLEELTRKWAKEYHELIVISGPVFDSKMKYLGANQIYIPNLFYKILLRHDSSNYKGIAFLLPNSSNKIKSIENYVCSIDSIESLTGLDFFTSLPDKFEETFEKKIHLENWDFNIAHHHTPNSISENSKGLPTMQCHAKTKKGLRCKNSTHSKNELCKIHGGD